MLFWCAWLLGSWVICLLDASPRLAARTTMPFAVLIGIMAVWPLLRLTTVLQMGAPPTDAQPQPPQATHVLREWLYLNLLLQTVLWPLKMNADWTFAQTVWLSAVFAGWTLITGLLIAVGLHYGSGHGRLLAMLGCLVLLILEPVWFAISSLTASDLEHHRWRLSPIQLVWRLSQPFAERLPVEQSAQIIAVVIAGIAGWLIYGLLVLAKHFRKPHTSQTG